MIFGQVFDETYDGFWTIFRLAYTIEMKVSINIMRAFVEMRKFVVSKREMCARLDRVELKQLETDKKLEEVFNASIKHAGKKSVRKQRWKMEEWFRL